MLGPVGLALLIAGFLVPLRTRAAALLYGWLAAGAVYAYVVVNVERVDYYLYPLVPLGAIVGGAFIALIWERFATGANARLALGALLAVVWLATAYLDRRLVRPYYAWNRALYRDATALDRALPSDALIVMAHYDPSVMYYIRRQGRMEDPLLWRPSDEQSAIRKGSRYFISIEDRRMRAQSRALRLAAALSGARSVRARPVYQTDPALETPPSTSSDPRYVRLRIERIAASICALSALSLAALAFAFCRNVNAPALSFALPSATPAM